MTKAAFRILVGAAVLAGLLVGGAAWDGHRRFGAPGPLAQPATVIIPRGAGTELIAQTLEAAGVVSSRWIFAIGAKLRHVSLKAGEYAFPARVSPEEAMAIIADGRVVIHKLTVAEGLTVRQVVDLVTEADFLAGSVTRKVEEGWLLPETWHMTRDETRDDLQARTPWNTYVIDGLPRTPIANPGRAALEAVLHPATSDALYFVADGRGGHAFARTLDEHHANVARWRKMMGERKTEGTGE